MTKANTTILALYPNTMGICYAVFDSPKNLVDYGIGHVRPVNNVKSLQRVEKYLEFYKPDIILLRGMSIARAKHSKRSQKLIELISQKAKEQNLKVHCYNRSQIKDFFSTYKATSKYQISQKIIGWFPFLEVLELPFRKRWMSEDHKTGVFDAIAIALVHLSLNDLYDC